MSEKCCNQPINPQRCLSKVALEQGCLGIDSLVMHVGNDDDVNDDEDKDTCDDKELEFTPQMMQTKDKSSRGFTTDLDCWHFSQ